MLERLKGWEQYFSGGKATKLGGGAFAVDTAMNLQGGEAKLLNPYATRRY